MRSIALVMIGMPLLIGCQQNWEEQDDSALKKMEQHARSFQLKETYYFKVRRTESPYKKLSRHKLDELIRHQIEVLKTPFWREAKVALTQIGKPAIPHLIEALSREDETAAEPRPRPGPKFDSDHMFNTLGEVAWSVLRDMILRHSNLRGRSNRGIVLPEHHEQKRWEQWWERFRGRLDIAG